MAFAFFVGPETKAIDADLGGVDDSEETQFVLTISEPEKTKRISKP